MGILWNRSGVVERYGDDLEAAGAQAFFFQGGTTTPLVVFQDGGESIAHPIPLLADANGRWPDVFIPYTISFDVRVTTSFGTQLTFTQQVPNPNPVSQTVIVPPQNQVQTGMCHFEFVQGSKVGYVRLNGLTIGNASSSAAERANADTSALFTYLWNNLNNTICPVAPGGRGPSASADFGANKAIGLPDMRGAAPQGLDDMGNSAAGLYSGLTFTAGDALTPGSLIGSNGVAITAANLPAHAHTGTTSIIGAHSHGGSSFSGSGSGGGATDSRATGISATFNAASVGFGGATGTATTAGAGGAFTGAVQISDPTHLHAVNVNVSVSGGVSIVPDGSHSHTFTTSSVGSGTVFNNLGVSRLVTWYIKL